MPLFTAVIGVHFLFGQFSGTSNRSKGNRTDGRHITLVCNIPRPEWNRSSQRTTKCNTVKDPVSSWVLARYLNSSVHGNCYLRRLALRVGSFDRLDLSPNITKTEPSPSVKKLRIGMTWPT